MEPNKTTVIPYTIINGQPTMSDDFLLSLYRRMTKEKTYDLVFTNGFTDTPDQFLGFIKNPGNLFSVVYQEETMVAIVVVNEMKIQPKMANLGFCSFKVDGIDKVDVGKDVLRQMIHRKHSDGEYIFDMFTGLTDIRNKVALEFIKRCGAKELGVLPFGAWDKKAKKSIPAMLFHYSREDSE